MTQKVQEISHGFCTMKNNDQKLLTMTERLPLVPKMVDQFMTVAGIFACNAIAC